MRKTGGWLGCAATATSGRDSYGCLVIRLATQKPTEHFDEVAGLDMSGPNPHRRLINNPELPGQRQTLEKRKNLANHRENSRFVEVCQPKHNHPIVFGRRIDTDVGKMTVQRHEHSVFTLADASQVHFGLANHLLLANGHGVVSCIREQLCYFARQIFIDFEPRH